MSGELNRDIVMVEQAWNYRGRRRYRSCRSYGERSETYEKKLIWPHQEVIPPRVSPRHTTPLRPQPQPQNNFADLVGGSRGALIGVKFHGIIPEWNAGPIAKRNHATGTVSFNQEHSRGGLIGKETSWPWPWSVTPTLLSTKLYLFKSVGL